MEPFALVLAACSGKPTEADPRDIEVSLVRVVPGEVTIRTSPDGADPVQFVASVVYEGMDTGTSEDVEWSVSNHSAGEIDEDGLFTPSTTNGGISWVTAKFAGVEGSATATVIYEEDRVEDGGDPGAFDAWGGTVTNDYEFWLYPEDGVNIPRNTPSIRFEWSDQAAVSYRLVFRSDLTNISVYTAATYWEADVTTWQTMASTNAGGSLTVELAAAANGQIYAAPPHRIEVNRMDAHGSIYYWSTSASGIKVIPYAGTASDFLTSSTIGYCTACHQISSAGIIAFTYDGGNGPLGLKRVSDGSDVVAYGSGYYGNFETFSPDGSYLVSTYEGSLLLYDGLTGAYVMEIPVDGTATHPDWSPDGTRMAVVLTDGHSDDWSTSGGKIAIMEHVGEGQFDAPVVLYDPPDPYVAYYPAWSPDGDWIAFNLSTGDTYYDGDAELYVVDGEGGTPIRLDAANKEANLTNSWPRWGPLPDDDILWLATSSTRAYGTVSTSGLAQIWITAFDPAKAKQGQDPSWPAFWMPGQDPAQSNHIPVWVE